MVHNDSETPITSLQDHVILQAHSSLWSLNLREWGDFKVYTPRSAQAQNVLVIMDSLLQSQQFGSVRFGCGCWTKRERTKKSGDRSLVFVLHTSMCARHARKLSLWSYCCQVTSPAGRQDGHRHGNRLALIRAAWHWDDELHTWLSNLREKEKWGGIVVVRGGEGRTNQLGGGMELTRS